MKLGGASINTVFIIQYLTGFDTCQDFKIIFLKS